jgi:hypothetical protein
MNTIPSLATAQAQTHSAKPKHPVFIRVKRIALRLVIGIIALTTIGAIYQAVATEMDKRAYAPPGQMVDVGGYSLHLYCTGANVNGSPTVILEQGGGGNTLGWFLVQPEVAKACNARVVEFCKRLQTQEGFVKAKADENAAKMCGVSAASIKAAQCPKAAQSGSLAFIGAYCPVEAKPIAMEHCGGRDYTSKLGCKYAAFCSNYLANEDFERPPGAVARPAAAKSASGTAGTTTQQAPAQPQSTEDQVKQGVSKGLDKLKGFFGR